MTEIVLRTPKHAAPGTYLAFDCETFLITPECITPTLVSIQISQAHASTVYSGPDLGAGIIRLLQALDDGQVIIAHNGFFDWAVVLNVLGWDEDLGFRVFNAYYSGQLRDTLTKGKLHAIEMGTLDVWKFSLSALAERYCGESIEGKSGPDIWRLRYSELYGIPSSEWPLEAYSYARLDPVWVEKVYDAMGVCTDHFHDEAFQNAKTWSLYLAGVWGIRVNVDKVTALEDRMQPIIDKAVDELLKTGIYQYPSSFSRKKFGEWLATHVPAKRTAGGAVSLASTYLDKCAEVLGDWVTCKEMWEANAPRECFDVEGEPKRDMKLIKEMVEAHYGDEVPLTDGEVPKTKTDRETIERVPALKPLADIGVYQKLVTTYFPSMRASSSGVLHPYHDALKATGRNSVSRPNLNNQPKMEGVRECYEARDGYIMCSADYSQAELCSLAQVNLDLFGYSVMAEKINAGVDLHCYLASNVFGDSYDSLKEQVRAGDKVAKKKRQNMKAPNFGFPGGMGLDKFLWVAQTQYEIEDVDLAVVKEWKDAWLRTWPEMNNYFGFIGNQTAGKRKFTAVQHRSGRRRGDCGYCDGANTFFQGMTADGAGLALILVTREAHYDPASPLYGARIIAFIYDELLVEWPDRGPAANTAAANRLVEIMETAMEVFTPDVKATVEPALMYEWSKRADPVWNADGHLVAWTAPVPTPKTKEVS